MVTLEKAKFGYKGFDCEIIERPDKYYCYQVFGRRVSDGVLFYPEYFFDKELSLGQIRDICIKILDGKFSGKAEIYNELVIVVG